MVQKQKEKLKTEKLGELSYNKEDVIRFEDGIVGYEELKQFVLINFPDCRPFEWLVSVDNPIVAFPVINPMPLFTDYNPLKAIKDVSALGVKDKKKIETFCIVNVGEDTSNVTINLKGPILVNMENNKGKQFVLTEDFYTLHYPLIQKK
ncbi:MAG: flagellar assembly protein FliW [Planctomycetes bacterium]|nr:flagellar assembly protein FliW [Planctomycetota bacterium]